MWGPVLVFLSCVAAQVSSEEITVECHKDYTLESDSLPISDKSPSRLADLKVDWFPRENDYLLNISWAISIDASIKYLTGTRLVVDGEPIYVCGYKPNMAEANLTESKQKWFHYEMPTGYGYVTVQASNLPLPPYGSGLSSLAVTINLPRLERYTLEPVLFSRKTSDSVLSAEPTTSPWRTEHATVVMFGVLGGLLILSSCYIIYKNLGRVARFLGFENLTTSTVVPVPVLMVYSAENSAFQQAVVALAEFLQFHGGCSVAVDMWQQGKIAELGPMRWLIKQIEAAERVLIVCPQVDAQSLPTKPSPSRDSFLQPSIPAATHDLFPLILNIVASHAKNASELAKFWVVQLGEHQDQSNLPPQLRVCKTFCLMRSLNNLCRSLHSQGQSNKKTLGVLFKPGVLYSKSSTVKLREAVNRLICHQPNICSEMEPLKSVMSV